SNTDATYKWSRSDHPWGRFSFEIENPETGEVESITRDSETDVLVVFEDEKKNSVVSNWNARPEPECNKKRANKKNGLNGKHVKPRNVRERKRHKNENKKNKGVKKKKASFISQFTLFRRAGNKLLEYKYVSKIVALIATIVLIRVIRTALSVYATIYAIPVAARIRITNSRTICTRLNKI
ncbi:MAG: hypothetical protein GY801_10435, partial [bacterium]|nr:hypothetical protein [bacterium]